MREDATDFNPDLHIKKMLYEKYEYILDALHRDHGFHPKNIDIRIKMSTLNEALRNLYREITELENKKQGSENNEHGSSDISNTS